MGIGALSGQQAAGLRRAVFLDRDGVLNGVTVRNGKPYPPRSLAELEILPGVNAGLRLLRQAGFLLIGATNQPDVVRGLAQRETVEAMNARLLAELELDEIRTCWHDDADGCACRKPKPGMLLDAARERQIDLVSSYMLGDRWRDIEAGQAAGCRTVWLRAPYAERGPSSPADFVADRFEPAVRWVLNDASSRA
jgi:D-glycero-D-manno-heptose 1,7-bisphosphate phosphatase